MKYTLFLIFLAYTVAIILYVGTNSNLGKPEACPPCVDRVMSCEYPPAFSGEN